MTLQDPWDGSRACEGRTEKTLPVGHQEGGPGACRLQRVSRASAAGGVGAAAGPGDPVTIVLDCGSAIDANTSRKQKNKAVGYNRKTKMPSKIKTTLKIGWG